MLLLLGEAGVLCEAPREPVVVGEEQAEGVAVGRALLGVAVAVCSPPPSEPVPCTVAVGGAEAVEEGEAQATLPLAPSDAEPVEQALSVGRPGLALAQLLPAALSDGRGVPEAPTVLVALLPREGVALGEGDGAREAVAAPALVVAPLPREAVASTLPETLAQGEGEAVRVCVTDTDTDPVGVGVCEDEAQGSGVPVLAPPAPSVGVAPTDADCVAEGVKDCVKVAPEDCEEEGHGAGVAVPAPLAESVKLGEVLGRVREGRREAEGEAEVEAEGEAEAAAAARASRKASSRIGSCGWGGRGGGASAEGWQVLETAEVPWWAG